MLWLSFCLSDVKGGKTGKAFLFHITAFLFSRIFFLLLWQLPFPFFFPFYFPHTHTLSCSGGNNLGDFFQAAFFRVGRYNLVLWYFIPKKHIGLFCGEDCDLCFSWLYCPLTLLLSISLSFSLHFISPNTFWIAVEELIFWIFFGRCSYLPFFPPTHIHWFAFYFGCM